MVLRRSAHAWAPIIALALVPLSACYGSIDDPDVTRDVLVAPVPDFAPGSGALLRLTNAQYENSIHAVLGEEIVVTPNSASDASPEGLTAIEAGIVNVSSRDVTYYESTAYQVAGQAMAEGVRDGLVTCTPADASTSDTACATTFAREMGLRIWRRPLTDAEVERLVAVADEGAETLGDFYQGLEFILGGLLQSPHFLFRADIGDAVHAENADWRAFDGYEMAARLSFFLWNETPDDALLQAAAEGRLTSDEGLSAELDRMLDDPRARRGISALFNDMLGLELLDELDKLPEIFPLFTPDLGADARTETLAVLDELVFERGGDYRDIVTTRRAYVNRRLAAIYRLTAPSRDGFGFTEFPEDSLRSGVLGHISVLAGNSHPDRSSATGRGAFIRKRLLCGSIPAPPADMNVALPEPSGTAVTLRDRVQEHLQNPVCAGCHILMDPIGLSLENYDGLGQFRLLDNGAPVNASGKLNGEEFENPAELGVLLRDDPDLSRCLVRTMYRYATGTEEETGETIVLRELEQSFAEAEYRVLPLVRALVMHRGFRSTTTPHDEAE